eukprot:gene7934-biopygen7137
MAGAGACAACEHPQSPAEVRNGTGAGLPMARAGACAAGEHLQSPAEVRNGTGAGLPMARAGACVLRGGQVALRQLPRARAALLLLPQLVEAEARRRLRDIAAEALRLLPAKGEGGARVRIVEVSYASSVPWCRECRKAFQMS